MADAETLFGLAERAGELRGYGTLPAARVRDLAYRLRAEWSGVLVDQQGHAVALAATKYRFRGRLAEFVRLRDRTCAFPACNRGAEFSDVDHIIPYQQGGATSAANGHCLCRRHHRMKQSRTWTVNRRSDGLTRWTRRVGDGCRRSYTKTPEPIAERPPPYPAVTVTPGEVER